MRVFRVTAWQALIVAVLAASCGAIWGFSGPALASVPSDLDKTTIVGSGLSEPTAFRIAPDGRILIAEKGGAIRLYKNGTLQTSPMGSVQTANSDERGLLGIELDPNFATNGYLYVAYTHADNHDQLSRLHITGDTIDAGSEVVLLKSDQEANVFHHGGEIRFGADGKLYWSLGMNLYSPNSQNLGTIQGKILRLNSDGTVPADNPFYNTPGAQKAIWAYRIRNAFRFDMLPAGAGVNANKPIVGDVGGSNWEELDVINKAANYGWPAAEGDCANCGYANPVFSYAHSPAPASAGSVSGVAVNTQDALGSRYKGAVFYADYTLGFIKYLIMDSDYATVLTDNEFDMDAGTPTQISFGPDGALYQLNIYPGALYKVVPSGGNREPTAVAAATPVAGLAPLNVTFSSAGSRDPDGTSLTYLWDFKDGTTSTAANPVHSFSANGTYNVTLTVSDGSKTGTATSKVTVGNRLPTGTITAPTDQQHYNAGDTITYGANATDPEDGTLPASAYSWKVIFHHADHVHPFLGPINGAKTGSFVIPRNADNVATTSYEIQLTVTDSGGLSSTSSVMIVPNIVTLTFNASPSGATYTIDGQPFTGSRSEQAVVGVDRVVNVASPQFVAGQQYKFANWSDGGAQTHTIRTPNTNQAYQVNMAPVTEPPAPWVSKDIGARTVAGSSAYDSGTYTITGGGNDIWGTTDEFRYVYQPLNGDGEIVARVTAQSNTDPWAKSGVMIKESATEGAKYVLVGTTPGNGMHMQYNFTGDAGSTPYTFPNGWMKLKRVGNVFTAYKSVDGTNWTQIGTTTLAMNANATVGLYVNAHKDTAQNTSTFDNVSVTTPTVTTLPAPWQRVDVGGAQPTGSATFANNAFTIKGGGTDIWGTADQSSYVYEPLNGDGSITTRVSTQDNTDPWAKSGIMIKQSTTAGSKYVSLFATPANGLRFQYNFSGDQFGGAFTLPNGWIRLTRTGDVFTAYKSADGVTWTKIGQTTLAMTASATIGMFVNAHNGGTALNTSVFDNITVTGATSTGLPSPWVSHDIGAPALAGSASYAANTFTLKGSGNDIWGTTDQHQFVHQPLTGDGSIVARVTAQDNTDPWAKSGIMIKDSLTTGSPYAAIMVTPANGIHAQANYNSDTAGGSYTVPNAWLKLSRTGNTITTYKSTDGTTWIKVGTTTVALGSTAQVGLFVNAHNGSVALNTTKFDNVSVTPAATNPLPTGWQGADIGSPAVAGSESYASGAFTVKGAGTDIWGSADQSHFTYKALPGDGSITARLTAQENTDPWAKSGVMIKQSTTAGTNYALLAATPSNGIHFQSNFTADKTVAGTTALPVWLRLTRAGNVITAATSADGTSWTTVGTQTVALNGAVTIGLVVNAHNGGTDLNTSIFDNVSVQ